MIVTDAVVIGGGIAGASLAAELSSTMHVVLLEREAAAGYHATGRSAAMFVPNYGDDMIRRLSGASRAHFDGPDPEFWPEPLLSPRGLLRVARDDGLRDYRAQTATAAGIEALAIDDALRLFPALRRGRFVEASYESDVHDIDVDALLQGYLRRARRAGARIETGCEPVSIERVATRWRVRTARQDYSSAVLVDAAGAWADAVAVQAGAMPLGLRACRRTVAVLPRPAVLATKDRLPFTVPFPLGWYAKSEPGRLLVSSAEQDPVMPADAWVDDLALAEGLDRFMQDTTVEVTRVESSWAGLRTFAPDEHPVVGFDPDLDGFLWFAGQGGFGIQTAPALARIGAACVTGAADPAGLLDALSPARLRG